MRWITVNIVSLWLLVPVEYAAAQALDALSYETVEPVSYTHLAMTFRPGKQDQDVPPVDQAQGTSAVNR